MGKRKNAIQREVTVHQICHTKQLSDEAKAMLICVLDNAKRLVIDGTISELYDVGVVAGHLRDIVVVATDDEFEGFQYGCNGDAPRPALCLALQDDSEREFPWGEVLSNYLQREGGGPGRIVGPFVKVAAG